MPAFSLPAGVPPLLPSGYLDFNSSPPVLLTTDDPSVIQAARSNWAQQWGLFLNGIPQVFAESVVAFAYKQDWTVSDYSVEGGGFESYDKVQLPFDARIRFSAGSSDAARQDLLASVAGIAQITTGTQKVYEILTPEYSYPSVTISHIDYDRRDENGQGLIVIDVWCTEVRQTGQQTFTQTKQPSGTDPLNAGVAQPSTPTSSQTALASGAS